MPEPTETPHSSEPLLEFLPNDADEGEGLGHAGIQTYKDSPFSSVARECGQNSADARLHVPVKIAFDLLTLKDTELPAIGDLRLAVEACLQKSKESKDEKYIDFFSQAKKVINAGEIKVLSIADDNTTGLTGPCIEGLPFHALLKGSGQNVKESDAAGGSFGIGKNAVFAISDLQTVFYSTIYEDQDSGEKKFLAQGKSILISHKGKDGRSKRSTGYWGSANFMPVEDADLAPHWLRRVTRGASIFAIGISETQNWQFKMAASLLMNFFCAIHRGEMVFTLDNNAIQITRETISELFENHEVLQAAEDSSTKEDFIFASNLYECLVSNEVREKICHIDDIEEVSIRILVRDGLSKRLWIVRNGMAITDSLANFGDKLARFPMSKDFVALVEPVTEAGRAFIKKLENPAHDGLSAERVPDPKKRRAAQRAMKKFAENIREAIREETQVKSEKEMDLDELAEFFGDTEKFDMIPDPKQDENPETYKYKPMTSAKRKKPPVNTSKNPGNEGGAGGRDRDGGRGDGGNGGNGEYTGGGAGGDGTKSFRRTLLFREFRNMVVDNGGKKVRKIFFTSPETCDATIKVQASGIYSNEDLKIISSNRGAVNSGSLKISLNAGERTAVEVEFSEEFEGPIELIAERE